MLGLIQTLLPVNAGHLCNGPVRRQGSMVPLYTDGETEAQVSEQQRQDLNPGCLVPEP